MDWIKLEGFDEKYAKIKRKEHKKFGGKVVEVLYGAQDSEGNPVMPKEGGDDGHGRWFGIDIDGEHRMFSLKKPASQGGEEIFTTDSKEHALEDMESTIQEKQTLCREGTALLQEMHTEKSQEALNELKEKWNALKDWETPKEAELQKRFDEIVGQFDEVLANAKELLEEKKEILEEAKGLAESTAWEKTNNKFQDLRRALRNIGRIGGDEEIEKEFKSLQNAFNQKRKEYYTQIDTIRAVAKEKKEALIEKAKEIANLENVRSASDKMNNLMNDWKAAGSAGHRVDEELWEVFRDIRSKFNEKRQVAFEEHRKGMQESVEIKKSLIEKAQAIADSKDFSKEKTDEMKALDVEWRKAGYSGKAENDKLWDAYNAVKDIFWNGKREDNQKRLAETVERKENTLKKIREEIEDLGIKEYETDVYDEIRDIQQRIEQKKNTATNIEEELKKLKARLAPKVEEFKENLKATVEDVKEEVQDLIQDVKEGAQEIVQEVKEEVEELTSEDKPKDE